MTVDIYAIMVFIVAIVVVISVAATVIAIMAIWNGSIKRYNKQRTEHYEQFYRIQKDMNNKRQK